jgi:hypothetical protein
MKWKKLGQIFNPFESELADEFVGFAQSPQAIVFDDFVRIYFSIRKKSPNGKFVSHVKYIDYDLKLGKVLDVANHEVIGVGKLGCFDEHGIFPFSPVKFKDKVYGFTTGWTRRVSVSVDACIGLAISEDNGKTFKRIGDGPVLATSLNEPCLVGDGFTMVENEKIRMWYIFCKHWLEPKEKGGAPERVYKIAYAESTDGINWTRDSKTIIPDSLGERECQALPTVFKANGLYHMYFCYRQAVDFRKNATRGYRIGYAYSEDGISWTRNDEKSGISVSDKGWDSEMQCYPNAFCFKGKVYLLYNGNEFGKYGFGLAELEDLT